LSNARGRNTKRGGEAGHWWLTPVILDTQEAEIRTVTVQSQSQKKKRVLENRVMLF
jgi:hypothetical protein